MSSLPTRRAVLKSMTVAGLAAACPRAVSGAAAQPAGRAAVLRYLETLARADGGYGWGDQESSHLTPTFAVIGAYRLLEAALPRRAALAEYVRTHHPRELKKLEQERRIFEWQQIQALVWLGADVSAFRPAIAALGQPMAYLKQYERHGYPIFQSEMGVVLAHALLGLPLAALRETFGRYLAARRRPNGSFNNTLAADGGDGHVMNTLWALQGAAALGFPLEQRDELVAWVRACQRPGGGFTYAPHPELGGVDDVAYTRAAVRTLRLLGAEPAQREACVEYLRSLANADGAFSDRPGWSSNPMATYLALDALDALGALATLGGLSRRPASRRTPLPAGLRICSLQLEAHGQGSAHDAVELARALKIDCWGAKNAKPGWLARARAIAARRQVPVQFFTANEEYGTWLDVPGLGTYSHTSDVMAPAEADIGPPVAGATAVTWADFRTRRLEPLQRGGGRLVWQFGENEELVRMLLDESVARGGFAAISTFHFGNPDFTNSEPFLHRWRGQIPYVALQDAHGPEPWWFSDQTTGFRTLFLAPAPTWDGWLHALRQGWVVAVRHDGASQGRTWYHSGADEVLELVRAREREWRWWDNPACARPMVSLVALTPADEAEAGRPAAGTTLRVRCAWENTPQGLARTPLAELVRLLVDGREVQPERVARQRPNGLHEDHCHLYALPAGTAAGPHTATAVVRVLADRREVERTVAFDV